MTVISEAVSEALVDLEVKLRERHQALRSLDVPTSPANEPPPHYR